MATATRASHQTKVARNGNKQKKQEICFPATSDACVRTTWLVFMAIGDFFSLLVSCCLRVWGGFLKGATEILLEEEKEVGERKKPFPGRHNSQEQPHRNFFHPSISIPSDSVGPD